MNNPIYVCLNCGSVYGCDCPDIDETNPYMGEDGGAGSPYAADRATKPMSRQEEYARQAVERDMRRSILKAIDEEDAAEFGG